jgi:flagellar hook assembly protein FlgD
LKKNIIHIIALIALLTNVGLSQLPIVKVMPGESYLELYETKEIFVQVENIEGFRAYSISLSYDSQKLRCLSIIKGSFFSNWNTFFFTLIDSNSNTLMADEAILGVGFENGNGDLFKVQLLALEEGDVIINIVNAELRDTLNNYIQNQTENGVIHIINPNSVEENNDDEPVTSIAAYPNPFNSSTRIEFISTVSEETEFSIYSIIGERVFYIEPQSLNNNYYSIQWDGQDSEGNFLPSGIYLLTAGSKIYSKTFKLVLLK